MKPDHICHADGCSDRATLQATLILRGSPIKGATTVKVCQRHRRDAEGFILNDENRTRLVDHLVTEGFASRVIARGHVKYNAAVEFDPIAS